MSEELRLGRRGERRRLHHPRRLVLLDARPQRLRQDDDAAHDRRLRGARRRPRPAAGRGHHLGAAGQAARQHGVPGLRPVPAHDRGREHRVRAADQAAAEGRDPPAGGRDARHRPAGGHGEAAPGAALRRPAAAGRAGPRAGQPAGGAAARRAAGRARPEAAQGDAARAEAAAVRDRHHLRVRHARPGGGADDERLDRRDERRRGRAAGAARASSTSGRRPTFVAGFIGTSNLLTLRVDEREGDLARDAPGRWRADPRPLRPAGRRRPRRSRCARRRSSSATTATGRATSCEVTATVADVVYLGSITQIVGRPADR